MNHKPTGISTGTYKSILKDISLIYENAQDEGDGNWNKTNLFAHYIRAYARMGLSHVIRKT
jgi:hypothetical protein